MSRLIPAAFNRNVHFIDGDHACCEGCTGSGCAVCRRLSHHALHRSGGALRRPHPHRRRNVFIQMEDELAASITMLGCRLGRRQGLHSHIRPRLLPDDGAHRLRRAMTETPCVFVDVQRGGPSTGLPTLPAQADMMQARWGSHGDYEMIALCPNSPQECFDLTITRLQPVRAVPHAGHVHDG